MIDSKMEIERKTIDCLVDLLDNEFTLLVKQLTGYHMIRLTAKKSSNWSEIKDSYLFFLEIMLDDYKLSGRHPFIINGEPYTLKDLNNFKDSYYIQSIIVFLG